MSEYNYPASINLYPKNSGFGGVGRSGSIIVNTSKIQNLRTLYRESAHEGPAKFWIKLSGALLGWIS